MKNLLFSLLGLLPLCLSAQLITVSESIPLGNDTSYDILGELGGQILLFRDSRIDFEVQAFNPQLKESWSKEIFLDKRQTKVLGTIADKEGFSLLYTFRERGNTIVKMHRYDPAANLVDSSTIVSLGSLFFTPRFELIRSEDRSKLLLFYAENQETIHSFAIDIPTQSLLWANTIAPENFLYNRDFSQAVLDNKGQMNIILTRDNYRSKRKQHYFEIFTCNSSDKASSVRIYMNDFITYDVLFKADNLNNQLVVAGLYSLENGTRSEGVFYFKFQPNSEQQPTISYNKYEETFLQNLLNKSYREGRGLKEVSVRELVIRRDGGVLMIAERNHEFQRRTGSTARTTYHPGAGLRMMIDYYFEEIFIMSIHPTGEIHWKTILHKKQYSQDDNGIFSSYFLFETPGKLRFLFNDEISFESTISEYIIDGLGNYDRNSLFSTVNLDLRLRFKAALQVAANSLIIPSERRNRLKLVRLDY